MGPSCFSLCKTSLCHLCLLALQAFRVFIHIEFLALIVPFGTMTSKLGLLGHHELSALEMMAAVALNCVAVRGLCSSGSESVPAEPIGDSGAQVLLTGGGSIIASDAGPLQTACCTRCQIESFQNSVSRLQGLYVNKQAVVLLQSFLTDSAAQTFVNLGLFNSRLLACMHMQDCCLNHPV